LADNLKYTEPVTGTVIASDDVAGVHYQFVKIAYGALDTATIVTSSVGLPVAQAGTWPVVAAGDVAHDAADSGNPLKMGAVAVAFGAAPTAAAAADRTNLYATRHGMVLVIGGHPNIRTTRVNYAASAQTNAAIVTPAAGKKLAVTQIILTSDNASTAFPSVLVGFHATTTPTGDGCLLHHPGVPAGGGCLRGSGSAVIGVGAADEKILVTSGAATGGSISIVISYFEIDS
jgi:hypothetical protein